jgi:hypothetical protein
MLATPRRRFTSCKRVFRSGPAREERSKRSALQNALAGRGDLPGYANLAVYLNR